MKFNEFQEVLKLKTGKSLKKAGQGYMTCCPAHEDDNPSLSISESPDKILLNCFAGCRIEAICSSLGLTVPDLFDKSRTEFRETSRIVYSYRDELDHEIYRKVRVEPGSNGKAKDFFCEHTQNGQIIKNLKGCRKILYRLPELLKAISNDQTVFIVEGEKDVDKLYECGLTATTSIDSLSWPNEFTEILINADVVVLYDMDKTGFARRDLLCQKLKGRVKRLRVVTLPGLEYQESHGKDISDWLASGNTSIGLLEILAKTSEYITQEVKTKILAVTVDDFLKMELPEREMILTPFLPSQGLCLLYAKRGIGKTHVALGIAYAVSVGGKFLKWEALKPRKVLYIDGEMPGAAMQERLRRISLTEDKKSPAPDYLRLITPDLQDGPLPDLSTKEGRVLLEELIGDSELIIVDNLSSLFRTGIENEAESWQPVQDWALDMRRRGKSILFVHHAGKTGQQRGTSKREDILDVVVVLKQPQGYCNDQGACFEIHYEKTRHFAGSDASPFRVQLKEQLDGIWIWEISESDDDIEVNEVSELINAGLTIKEITDKTGLSKSQVETRKKRAKSRGLIKD